MSTKLFLTDNTSALGRALEHELEREFFTLLAPGSDVVDWDKPASLVDYVRRAKPDLVINTRAWEDVLNPEQQRLLPQSVSALVEACGPARVPLIQFSSYRVFGPDNKSIHSEKDEPAPASDAGRALLSAEQALRALDKHICLRLSWVVGSYGENSLTRLLNTLTNPNADALSVSSRLRGAPTPLSDVARVVVAMAKQISCGAENWGTMHYCTGEACSEAEFAGQVVQALQQLDLLDDKAALTVTDKVPDGEPVSAVLICRRVRDYFGIQSRVWRPSLLPMIKQWLHSRRD